MTDLNLSLSVDDARMARLRIALANRADADQTIQDIALAGADEILALASGEAVFSNMSDLRAFRIYCLIRRGIQLGDVELIVQELFKVPPNTAKRLVNQTLARYAVDLEAQLKSYLKDSLEKACWEKATSQWRVTLPSAYAQQRLLGLADQSQQPTPTPAGRGLTWLFAQETFEAVRALEGLKPKAKTDCPK
jgi:hypothetical protein